MKKDPGIPNLFPYKDKLLHEIEEKKRLKEEEAVRKKEGVKARRDGVADTSQEDMEGSKTTENGEEELLDDEEMDEQVDVEDSNPMAALLASARARAAVYDGDEDDASADEMDEDDESGGGIETHLDTDTSIPVAPTRPETSRRAFDKVFKSVTSSADVILYVLDARDPEGTRSKEVERQIMAAEGGNKRLILILNKIDLVPSSVLKAWLVYLRRYFPTLPIRASNPAPNAKTFDHKHLTVKGTSETLFRALKSYAHSKQLKRSISVGVIGYPNVGKSSVINALTSRLGNNSSTACPVGAEAGVTTSLREVKLDNKLKLLDSPGIVFPSSASTSTSTSNTTASSNDTTTTTKASSSSKSKSDHQAHLILLNALPPKQIADPIPAVSLLLSRLSSSPALLAKLLDVYGLPPLITTAGGEGDTTTDFLIQVARKRGRLGKGGVPNLASAAMTVITDWRDGRICGWVEAPVLEAVVVGGGGGEGVDGGSWRGSGSGSGSGGTEGGVDRKEIVQEWAKEFRIEGLWGDDVDAGTDADTGAGKGKGDVVAPEMGKEKEREGGDEVMKG